MYVLNFLPWLHFDLKCIASYVPAKRHWLFSACIPPSLHTCLLTGNAWSLSQIWGGGGGGGGGGGMVWSSTLRLTQRSRSKLILCHLQTSDYMGEP